MNEPKPKTAKRPPLLIRPQFQRFLEERLSDEERGKLLLAMMRYQFQYEEPKDLSDRLMMVFGMVVSFIDSDNREYNEKCRKNRENIKAYWERH